MYPTPQDVSNLNMLNLLTRSSCTRGKALLVCAGLISLMGCSTGEVSSSAPDTVTTPSTEESTAAQTTEQADSTLTAANPQPPSEPAASAEPHTPNSPTNEPTEIAASPASVDLVVGRQYADARNQLMQQGWVPAEGPEPGTYGVERMAYEAGFTEVTACAGSGLGQCRFVFTHATENQVLAVITVGGADLAVSDWEVSTPADGTPTVPTTASTPAEDSLDVVVIPAAFQGEWDFSPEACAVDPAGDGRLTIKLDTFEFWETTGRVIAADIPSANEIVLTTEAFSEGETYYETQTFRLSEEGTSLTDVNSGAVRTRCFGG